MSNNAVYATAASEQGNLTFRIGEPTTHNRAHFIRDAMDTPAYKHGVMLRVAHGGKQYVIKFTEVREVDEHGRGLGSERHWNAIPVARDAWNFASKASAAASKGWLTRYVRREVADRLARIENVDRATRDALVNAASAAKTNHRYI